MSRSNKHDEGSPGALPPSPDAVPEVSTGIRAGPARQPVSVSDWVERIRAEEMPALGATVAMVRSITSDDTASTSGLARVILQDAAMTTKVLKLANSAFYNPARMSISTISRAIVVLGFDVVAEMAIGIRLVDSLLSGGIRQRVLDEMALGFHAAVLARSIAGMRRDGRGEEMFIAALLSHLGEMAFWAFGGEAAARLDGLLAVEGVDPEEAQQSVLGFRLRQLSLGLAREWKLGTLLQSSLEGGSRLSPSERAIQYGQQLAVEARSGWERPAACELVRKLSDFVGMPIEDLQIELVARTQEAASIAVYFGASEAALRIPAPRKPSAVLAVPAALIHEPDPMLQLRILRELSGMIAAGEGLNQVMNLVLEGIYRGVGFDRVLYALLTPNRTQIAGKAGLGAGVESLRQRFIFSLDETPGDVFNEFFRRPRALRFQPDDHSSGIRAERLQLVTNSCAACVAPIRIKGRVIGLFYADRQGVERGIDDESFEAFQLFVQQISLVTGSA